MMFNTVELLKIELHNMSSYAARITILPCIHLSNCKGWPCKLLMKVVRSAFFLIGLVFAVIVTFTFTIKPGLLKRPSLVYFVTNYLISSSHFESILWAYSYFIDCDVSQCGIAALAATVVPPVGPVVFCTKSLFSIDFRRTVIAIYLLIVIFSFI